jgi:HEPN domain-containing protein
MPNKTYALEWLSFSKRNLETAILLFNQKHYSDIIAIEIHQSLEKALKALYAYYGISIRKTHSLIELFENCNKYIDITDISLENIIEISDYYDSERYPGPSYFIPSGNEIEKNIAVASVIYDKVKKAVE